MINDHTIAGLRQARGFVDGLPEDLTQFGQDSKLVDMHLNHGLDSGASTGTYLRFANTTMHRELSDGVGDPISDDDYAHAQRAGAPNVQQGAVNLAKEITNLHHNSDNDNVVMSVRNLVKNPDGSTGSFEGPWSDKQGNVVQIPLQDLKTKAAGAGHLADGMSRLHMETGQHPTRSDLLKVIDTKMDQLHSTNAPTIAS